MWGALSDKRTGLQLRLAVGPFRVQVPRESSPHFTVSNLSFPNLEGQVPLFISTRNRAAQLYPQESAQSQSYLSTDGHSASLSWYQATTWDQRRNYILLSRKLSSDIFCLILLWGALSDKRTGL
jgi:hypothetical protein